MTCKEIINWVVQIIFGGGIVVFIIQIFREKKFKLKEKEAIKKSINELFNEEVIKNLSILDSIETSCKMKIEKPQEVFESNNIFFCVLNYVLANLIELNISKSQFRSLLELKTALDNVLFWQDEYVNGTKGKYELMIDKTVIDYYIPRIEHSITIAKNELKGYKEQFLAIPFQMGKS